LGRDDDSTNAQQFRHGQSPPTRDADHRGRECRDVDRAALVTFLASAVALAVAPWRAVRRPPVIAAIIALVGLSIIELVDLGALSTLRIRL